MTTYRVPCECGATHDSRAQSCGPCSIKRRTAASLGLERIRSRFNAMVAETDDETSCWLWTGFCDRKGRARFNASGSIYAARVALLLDGRPVPSDRFACHHCDNPRCVRPSHLYVGTASDNARDAFARGRRVSPNRHLKRMAVAS